MKKIEILDLRLIESGKPLKAFADDDLFDYQDEPVHRIIFPVSRLVLDPERFLDDAQEPMVKKGMGVVYMKASDGRPFRSPGFVPTKRELVNIPSKGR